MNFGSIEPGDATHYRYAFEVLPDGKLFFAFNSGYSDALVGNTWDPEQPLYIAYGYFVQQMGGDKSQLHRWTLGIAYVILHNLLGRDIDPTDAQKEALPYILSAGRLRKGWLDEFPSQYTVA